MSYTTNKSGIQSFVALCAHYGIKHVVCSPGSRNAPLVIAFDQDTRFETHVIHDERSAGFVALGMAIELKEPVAVCCTSGSAVANYFPAVTEAFYQCVPLVVISADRPKEWINHGDGQTIMQEGIFGKHVKAELTVPEFIEDSDHTGFIEELSRVMNLCTSNWSGPVHFNCPLSEPLYDTERIEAVRFDIPDKEAKRTALSDFDKEYIVDNWSRKKKKLILCGQINETRNLGFLLSEIAEDSSVAVVVENTSNLVNKRFIHCIDRTLVSMDESEIEAFQPDLLITIGGAVISKKIKAFLRKTKGLEHWKIGEEFPEMDTYRALSRSFRMAPHTFLKELGMLDLMRHNSTFGNKWKQRDLQIADALPAFLLGVDHSDLKTFEVVLDSIPEGAYLHMSNSSVVRYCQLFDPIPSIKYFSNRGTSGIDGSTSTAVGVATASEEKLNVLITGDVSFFYDSNGLWNNAFPQNLKIVVVNNGGGGIFRIIDGPSTSDQLERYFEARHHFSIEQMAKTFGLTYTYANSEASVEEKLRQLLLSPKAQILEVDTRDVSNEEHLLKFFNYIRDLKLSKC